ncbi:DUF1206 domain-containing protein [Leifsonia sp. fls2-241-R2A-40a]|uniref:DUF1206 domain-containing protein n=1 Tax=Leifsonia sp. fls2-241-R2A-40a TaxID=3040290 RepID=UPI00254C10CB|nr:DUF1206 domain-containing protein [Leifsonia sp. fls2-241-R2A-40a]
MSSATSAKRELRRAARTAGESTILEILARTGFAASALLQVLLGALAIQLGFNRFAEADQSGALGEVAKVPGGFVVLWICVVGLLSLALWLLIQALLVFGSTRRKWLARIVNIAKAAAYATLGLTALAFAQGHPTHASESTRHLSAGILSLPAGPLLLGVVGLVTVGVGGYFMAKAVRQTFTEDVVMPSGPARHGMLVLGTLGYLAKGLVVAVAGVLFVIAAIQARADDATGLSGALETFEQFPLGAPLLFLVGAGLIASGAYNAARAWLARL